MDEYQKNFREGYFGIGAGTAAHQAGQRRREAEDAGQGYAGSAPTFSSEQGNGVIWLLGGALVIGFIMVFLDFLLAAVVATPLLAIGTRLFLLPSTTDRPGWLSMIGNALIAYLLVLVCAIAFAGAAHLLVDLDDVRWIPTIEDVDGTGYQVIGSGWQSFLIPWTVGLMAGLWWLGRSLPPLRFGRWAGGGLLAGLATVLYVAGLFMVAAWRGG